MEPTLGSIYEVPLFESPAGEFRKAMEASLTAAGRPIPTSAQWKMILSQSRATHVIAGAGSGKSTALSLRVVFMHRFLGIPLNQITVVTFTRASRADMVKKLVRDMGVFGVSLSEEAARRVVRTFHSMVLAQTDSQRTFFEQIGEGGNTDDTESLGVLNLKQLDCLRKVFASAFRTNEAFRRAIGQVLLEKISAPRQSQYTDAESLEKAMAVAAPRDEAVTRAITDAWLDRPGIGEVAGVVWETVPIKTSKTGAVWHANGRVIESGMPIVLGCGGIRDAAKEPLDRQRYPLAEHDKDRTLNFLANVRLKVVATIATEKYLYIETDDDLADLLTMVTFFSRESTRDQEDTFPAFSLRIPGDMHSASIFECLYSLGTFVASMGVEVPAASTELADSMDRGGFKLEANLCRALVEFWPALHQGEHSTYDELFLQHGKEENAALLSRESLLPMKHLLIDEFQDISGQIVRWIKAIHAVLVEHGDKPAIMAVGDDWQSVYGWRGSDPEFMIRFEEHFGVSELVVMKENFRCGQSVVNTAELLVTQLTQSAMQKHGVASGRAAGDLGEVELHPGGDEDIIGLVDRLRSTQPDESLFILSRTNEGLIPFRRRYAKDEKITLLTMHRAKGLEADNVIIKGDCYHLSASPLRNAIYKLVGRRSLYDTAQRDEALRLAYVSITRARKKVFWFGEPSRPEGAFQLLSARS